MGIFDPKVEANIPVVQPQVQQSALGGIADWLTSGIASAQSRAAQGGPTAGERKDALELSQGVGLQNSLLKAEALRREGRVDEANRAEQQVLANAARDGMDLSSGTTKALYRATTGRDPSFMGMSTEQRMAEEVMATPEFQGAFMASYASGKEMTEEERKNVAFAQVVRIRANETMLTNTSIDWDQGRSQAFTGVISDFNATALGMLSVASSQGGTVSIDTLNQTQMAWETRKGEIYAQRGQGVSDEQWKPVQAQMDQTDRAFKTLLEISQVEGSRGLTAQAMQPIAAALMADTDLTALEKYAGINSLPKLVELGVVPPTEVYDVLKSIKVPDINTSVFSTAESGGLTGSQGQPTLFPQEVMDSIGGLSAVDALNQAKNIAKVNGYTTPGQMAQDPAARDSFTLLTSKAFAAMTSISKDNREFASQKTINEVFDGKVVANIDAVATTNPAQARTLFLQGEEALNQQHAVAVTAIRNQIDPESPLIWNGETETLEFQFNSLTRLGIGEDQLLELRSAADTHYGGDFMAMARDQARKLRVANDMENAYRMINTGTVQGLIGKSDELMQLAGVVRTLNDKRQLFSSKADALQVEKPTQTTANTIVSANMADRAVDFAQIRGFDRVSEDAGFLNAVGSTSNRLGIDPSHLLGVISFETVGTFSPSIKTPNGSATGLIQFLESTAKGLGTSTAMLKNMSRVQQMEYVEKYLAPYKGKMNNLGDVYMAVHWPAGVGKPDSYVMYRKGSKEYAANKNLDLDNDGIVTRGDTLQRVMSSFDGGGYSGGPSRGPENGALGALTPQVTTTPLENGPSAGSSVPQLGSAPSGVSVQDGVQVASMGANGSRAGRQDATDQAADVVRSSTAPVQPVEPAKDELSQSVAQEQDAAAFAKLAADVHGSGSSEAKGAAELFQKVSQGTAKASEVTKMIQATQALPRTATRQELLADLYEARDKLNGR